MSDTPRTKAATRMAFTSEHMVEIEEAQKMERELADSLITLAMLGDKHERELADMKKQSDPYEREAAKAAINVLKRELAEARKQRDELASALKSICIAIISEETLDITDLFKQSEAAIAATKGESHE